VAQTGIDKEFMEQLEREDITFEEIDTLLRKSLSFPPQKQDEPIISLPQPVRGQDREHDQDFEKHLMMIFKKPFPSWTKNHNKFTPAINTIMR